MKVNDNSMLLADKQITIVSDRKFYVDVDNIRLVYEDDKLVGYYFPDIVEPDAELKLWRAIESLEFIEKKSDTQGHTLGWKLQYGEKLYGDFIQLDGNITANAINMLLAQICDTIQTIDKRPDYVPEDDIVKVVRCGKCRYNPDNGGTCSKRTELYQVSETEYSTIGLKWCSAGVEVEKE